VYVPQLVCSLCSGTERFRAVLPIGNPSFGKSRPCICVEERQKSLRLQQRREAANLGAFREITFKTFDHRVSGVQEAFGAGVDFAANPRGWFFLIGPCGSGKTHLAAAIANERFDGGATVFFTTVPDLLDLLRTAFASLEKYSQLFSLLREVELLVLDDLGAQKATMWSNEKLLQILNYRAEFALPTIITAIPREFQGLDERLRSRLQDSRLVTTIIFEHAKDFRPSKLAPSRRT
jgi:DNA replication protein DnaC